jgi:hypothetical protein
MGQQAFRTADERIQIIRFVLTKVFFTLVKNTFGQCLQVTFVRTGTEATGTYCTGTGKCIKGDFPAVLWIRNILVRIRIRGSAPLTYYFLKIHLHQFS